MGYKTKRALGGGPRPGSSASRKAVKPSSPRGRATTVRGKPAAGKAAVKKKTVAKDTGIVQGEPQAYYTDISNQTGLMFTGDRLRNTGDNWFERNLLDNILSAGTYLKKAPQSFFSMLTAVGKDLHTAATDPGRFEHEGYKSAQEAKLIAEMVAGTGKSVGTMPGFRSGMGLTPMAAVDFFTPKSVPQAMIDSLVKDAKAGKKVPQGWERVKDLVGKGGPLKPQLPITTTKQWAHEQGYDQPGGVGFGKAVGHGGTLLLLTGAVGAGRAASGAARAGGASNTSAAAQGVARGALEAAYRYSDADMISGALGKGRSAAQFIRALRQKDPDLASVWQKAYEDAVAAGASADEVDALIRHLTGETTDRPPGIDVAAARERLQQEKFAEPAAQTTLFDGDELLDIPTPLRDTYKADWLRGVVRQRMRGGGPQAPLPELWRQHVNSLVKPPDVPKIPQVTGQIPARYTPGPSKPMLLEHDLTPPVTRSEAAARRAQGVETFRLAEGYKGNQKISTQTPKAIDLGPRGRGDIGPADQARMLRALDRIIKELEERKRGDSLSIAGELKDLRREAELLQGGKEGGGFRGLLEDYGGSGRATSWQDRLGLVEDEMRRMGLPDELISEVLDLSKDMSRAEATEYIRGTLRANGYKVSEAKQVSDQLIEKRWEKGLNPDIKQYLNKRYEGNIPEDVIDDIAALQEAMKHDLKITEKVQAARAKELDLKGMPPEVRDFVKDLSAGELEQFKELLDTFGTGPMASLLRVSSNVRDQFLRMGYGKSRKAIPYRADQIELSPGVRRGHTKKVAAADERAAQRAKLRRTKSSFSLSPGRLPKISTNVADEIEPPPLTGPRSPYKAVPPVDPKVLEAVKAFSRMMGGKVPEAPKAPPIDPTVSRAVSRMLGGKPSNAPPIHPGVLEALKAFSRMMGGKAPEAPSGGTLVPVKGLSDQGPPTTAGAGKPPPEPPTARPVGTPGMPEGGGTSFATPEEMLIPPEAFLTQPLARNHMPGEEGGATAPMSGSRSLSSLIPVPKFLAGKIDSLKAALLRQREQIGDPSGLVTDPTEAIMRMVAEYAKEFGPVSPEGWMPIVRGLPASHVGNPAAPVGFTDWTQAGKAYQHFLGRLPAKDNPADWAARGKDISPHPPGAWDETGQFDLSFVKKPDWMEAKRTNREAYDAQDLPKDKYGDRRGVTSTIDPDQLPAEARMPVKTFTMEDLRRSRAEAQSRLANNPLTDSLAKLILDPETLKARGNADAFNLHDLGRIWSAKFKMTPVGRHWTEAAVKARERAIPALDAGTKETEALMRSMGQKYRNKLWRVQKMVEEDPYNPKLIKLTKQLQDEHERLLAQFHPLQAQTGDRLTSMPPVDTALRGMIEGDELARRNAQQKLGLPGDLGPYWNDMFEQATIATDAMRQLEGQNLIYYWRDQARILREQGRVGKAEKLEADIAKAEKELKENPSSDLSKMLNRSTSRGEGVPMIREMVASRAMKDAIMRGELALGNEDWLTSRGARGVADPIGALAGTKGPISAGLRGLDSLTGLIRLGLIASPSTTVANQVGNLALQMVGGANPLRALGNTRNMYRVIKALQEAELHGKGSVTIPELRGSLKGFSGQEMPIEDLQRAAGSSAARSLRQSSLVRPGKVSWLERHPRLMMANERKNPLVINAKSMRWQDDMHRLFNFFENMRKYPGEAPFAQAQRTGDLFGNVANMTPIEAGIMRSVSPFWSFNRAMMGSASAMARNPVSRLKALGLYGAATGLNAERAEAGMEPLMQETPLGPAFRMGDQAIPAMRYFPHAQMMEQAWSPKTGPLGGLFSSMNPLFRIPYESWTKQDAFTGEPIQEPGMPGVSPSTGGIALENLRRLFPLIKTGTDLWARHNSEYPVRSKSGTPSVWPEDVQVEAANDPWQPLFNYLAASRYKMTDEDMAEWLSNLAEEQEREVRLRDRRVRDLEQVRVPR